MHITNNVNANKSHTQPLTWTRAVKSLLHPLGFTPKSLIEALSLNDKLRHCFSLDAGVSEGYSVGVHTEMVLEVADRFKHSLMDEVCPLVDWYEFLVFLALHDIGKGVANESDNSGFRTSITFKESELSNTKTIMGETMQALEISPAKIALFTSLLSYDSQGLYLRDHIGAEEVVDNMLELAALNGIDPVQFYQLFGAYHKVDAASYPALRDIFVMDEDALRHCIGNQFKVDQVQTVLKSSSEGAIVFESLLRDLSEGAEPETIREKFVTHLEALYYFLGSMHKEMLKEMGSEETFRKVMKGFRDLFLRITSASPFALDFKEYYTERVSNRLGKLVDSGDAPGALSRLFTLSSYNQRILEHFEDELINFRKNYLVRFSAEKVNSFFVSPDNLKLLKMTFSHGSNSALLPNLLLTDMQLMSSGRLFQSGIIPFSGELSEGAGAHGVNRYLISGTSLDDSDRALEYAMNEEFHTSSQVEEEELLNFFSHIERILKHSERMFERGSNVTAARNWIRCITAVYRLRTATPEVYEKHSAQLQSYVSILERDWNWYIGSDHYNSRMPKKLDPHGTLKYEHHDNYYAAAFETLQGFIDGLKTAMTKTVQPIDGLNDAITHPYGLIFASHTLHAPAMNPQFPSERASIKAAKLGKDIQWIFADKEHHAHLQQFLQLANLEGKVTVLEISDYMLAAMDNYKASEYLGDFASSKKLSRLT